MEQLNRYFIDTIKSRYAKFDGRASRSEFWYFTLFYFIFSIMLRSIDIYIINPMLGSTSMESVQGGFLQMIVALALLIPSLALTIRRLHDTGKSGWWLFIALVPIVGPLALLYFYVQDSQAGNNLYGQNPKGV